MDIMPLIMKRKYEDHDLLMSTEITTDPFMLMTEAGRDSIECTAHDWALGLEISGLLGCINTPHFGRLVEANVFPK